VNLNVTFAADHHVREAKLGYWNQSANGGAGAVVPVAIPSSALGILPLGNCGCVNCNGNNTPTTLANQNICSISENGIFLQPGIYWLSFTVDNDAAVCVGGINVSGQTDMWFELEGNITTVSGANVFSDNKHAGDYVQPYPLDDISSLVINGSACNTPISLNVSTVSTIGGSGSTNILNPALTYELYNPVTNTTSVITQAMLPLNINGAGLYNLKFTDIYGCYRQTFLNVTSPAGFSVTPLLQCVVSTGSVVSTLPPAGVIWTYSLTKFNGAITAVTTPTTPTISGLGIGNYTLTVTDVLTNCTATATFKIGKSFTSNLVASVTCLPLGGTSILTGSTSVNSTALNPFTSNFGNIPATTNTITTSVNTTGVFTFTATDAYGCSSSSTTIIRKQPTLAYTLLPGCNGPTPPVLTLSITNGWLNPTFNVVGNNGSGVTSAYPNYTLTLLPNVSGTIFGVAPSNLPPNYCPFVPAITNFQIDICPPVPCNVPSGVTTLTCANTAAGTNVSSFGGAFATGAWPLGTAVYVTGNLVIDVSTTIFNSSIYLAPNARITLAQSGGNLIVDNCEIKTCDVQMADGIYLNQSGISTLEIRNSRVSDLLNGICIFKQNRIKAHNNLFRNNGNQSIKIEGCSSGYNNVITHNTFETAFPAPTPLNPNPTLLTPFLLYPGTNVPKRSAIGVNVLSSMAVRIGVLANGVTDGNIFKNLECGINILTAMSTNVLDYVVNGNEFSLIKQYSLVGATAQSQAISSPLTNCKGSGLFFLGTQGSYRNIQATNNNFNNSDKAIIINKAQKTSLNLNQITNVLLGIQVHNNVLTTEISGNNLENVLQGILCNATMAIPVGSGLTNYLRIYRNNVKTRTAGINSGLANWHYPIGIKVQELSNTYYALTGSGVFNNIVELNSPKGVCFVFDNCNKLLEVTDNTARLLNTTTVSAPSTNIPLGELGYWVEKCVGTKLAYNACKGNFTNTTNSNNVHNSAGIYIRESSNTSLICNHITNTRSGFYILGNCTDITQMNIRTNSFNANRYPWFSMDLGTSVGTFGNVGFPAGAGMPLGLDNRNEFYNPSNIPNWTTQVANDYRWQNAAGVRINIYRFTSPVTAFYTNDYVNTNIGNSLTTQTYCNIPAKLWAINNNTAFNYDLCVIGSLANKMEPDSVNDIEDAETQEEVDEEVAAVYTSNPGLQTWLEKQTLFANLHQDSVYRNSNPDLLAFYNSTLGTNIAKLYFLQHGFTELITLQHDSFNFYNLKAQLAINNDALITQNEWEVVEKELNNIRLNTLGLENIEYTELQKEYIETTANSCPLMYGNAVYEARSLYMAINPTALWDDRALCTISSLRTTDQQHLSFDEMQEQQIEAQLSAERINNLKQGEINIFPNPADAQISVEYKCAETDGTLSLYSSTGVPIVSLDLPASANKTALNVKDLPEGIYIYKANFIKCGVVTGKLIIKR
jgi:hypothetical protein